MRIRTLLLTAILMLGLVVNAQAAKRYAMKNAIVEYEISGAQSGTETLYIENFGQKEARYITMTIKMFGFKSTEQTMMLIDGDWSYNIDLKSKEGTRVNLKKASEAMMKRTGSQNIHDFGKKAVKKMGGVKKGTEVVLGKKCEVIEFPNMKAWVYKQIPLKSTANFGGMEMNYTATSIKENASIPKGKLTIPKGVKITDAPDIGAIMQGRDGNNNPDMGENAAGDEEPVDLEKALGAFKSLF